MKKRKKNVVDTEVLPADINDSVTQTEESLQEQETETQVVTEEVVIEPEKDREAEATSEDMPNEDAEANADSAEEAASVSDETPVANEALDEMECEQIVRSVEHQKQVISYMRDLVFGLSAVLLLFMLIFRVIIVSGPSMMDTLYDGDTLLLISNVFYRNPKYGDIVVASKDTFKDGEPIIKRVIATEGQTVDIDFEGGIVYIDGVALEEPYTRTPTNYEEGMTFPLTVTEGCVFVMGDNRNDSLDSRSLQIGLVDRRELLGRAIFLVLPGEHPFYRNRDFTRIGVLN